MFKGKKKKGKWNIFNKETGYNYRSNIQVFFIYNNFNRNYLMLLQLQRYCIYYLGFSKQNLVILPIEIVLHFLHLFFFFFSANLSPSTSWNMACAHAHTPFWEDVESSVPLELCCFWINPCLEKMSHVTQAGSHMSPIWPLFKIPYVDYRIWDSREEKKIYIYF